MTRRPIDTSRKIEELNDWAKEKGVEVGDMISQQERLDVLQLLWTYRDLEATGITDMPATDLIVHRAILKPGTPIYRSKQKRFTPDKEWWLRKFVLEGMESGMYERTTTSNGKLSPWGAAPVLARKAGKIEPRLTFNYHYVFEEPPANHMELASRVHNFLSLPTHQWFSVFDLKNAYWTVVIHPDDRWILAFSIPGIG